MARATSCRQAQARDAPRPVRPVLQRQRSAMALGDLPAEHQSDSGASRLGGKEGHEQVGGARQVRDLRPSPRFPSWSHRGATRCAPRRRCASDASVALRSRLMSTCSSWSGSPWTVSGGPGSTCGRQPRFGAHRASHAIGHAERLQLRARQLGQARISADEAGETIRPRGDDVEAAPHVLAPVLRQAVPRQDALQAAGDGFDGRQRVVQLVAQHPHQALPGLQFLLAQGLGEVGDDHQFERQPALADSAPAHSPAPRAAGKRRLQSALLRAFQARVPGAIPPPSGPAGARPWRPAGARPRGSPAAAAGARRRRRWPRRFRA